MTGGLTCGGLVGVGLAVADGVAVGVRRAWRRPPPSVAGEADLAALADALACAAVESAAFLAVVDPDARRTPSTPAITSTATAATPASSRRPPRPVARQSRGPAAPPRRPAGGRSPAGVPSPGPAPPAAGCTS